MVLVFGSENNKSMKVDCKQGLRKTGTEAARRKGNASGEWEIWCVETLESVRGKSPCAGGSDTESLTYLSEE
jgi:hypothetical protein